MKSAGEAEAETMSAAIKSAAWQTQKKQKQLWQQRECMPCTQTSQLQDVPPVHSKGTIPCSVYAFLV
jgi:hypothetical protein